MGHMRAILDEMNAGAFKIDNSTPLAGVIRVCTEYGVTPYQGNYFAQRLDVVRFPASRRLVVVNAPALDRS